ncbi:MAG TPA: ATP-binding protein [bacterium]|nr:ATP-binding protein [bacterium]HPS28867.1 ATP-binding protein [bacterium]
MIKDVSLKIFLAIALSITGIFPVATAVLASYSIMQNELKEQAFSQLESVLNVKKSILEDHFRKNGVNYSISFIDLVMNERSSMGKTGETYIVGPDFRMRSDSSLDPVGHSVTASKNGSVEKNGADTIAVRRALSGNSGRDIITDYRKRQVLSVYSPLKVDEKTIFAVIAEIDEKEIDDRIAASLNSRMLIIILVSISMMLLSAFIFSRIINRNIQQIISELGNLLNNVLRGNFSSRASEDLVGSDFREIVRHMNYLVEAYSLNNDEKKKLEEAVEYNQRLEAIGTLAGGIAHDFNNILSYTHAYAELALDESKNNHPASEHINEIIKGMDRAAKLISQIMTFSRQKDKEKQTLDVSAFIKETVKMLSEILPKNISVECVAEKGIHILADPVSIHQIVINLCTNSFHAMQENGGKMVVRLHVSNTDPKLCHLIVEDNGTGMTEEVKNRMFEPFFTTKPRGKGTGMGLSVVHGAVKEIGGSITVETCFGKGTAIEIILPVVSENISDQQNPKSAELNTGSESICLVDDEAEIVRSHTIMLENMGFHVEGFTKPSSVIETLSDDPFRYDLIITDFNMPEMNGVEFAKKIRGINQDQKLILITGYNDLISGTDIDNAGFSSVIFKPFSQNTLSDKIKSAVAT